MWLRSVHLSHTAILCDFSGTSRHFTTPHDGGMAVALNASTNVAISPRQFVGPRVDVRQNCF
jgi:hypothetical protein